MCKVYSFGSLSLFSLHRFLVRSALKLYLLWKNRWTQLAVSLLVSTALLEGEAEPNYFFSKWWKQTESYTSHLEV